MGKLLPSSSSFSMIWWDHCKWGSLDNAKEVKLSVIEYKLLECGKLLLVNDGRYHAYDDLLVDDED